VMKTRRKPENALKALVRSHGRESTDRGQVRLGRPENPNKKRGNENYQSLTVYVLKQTHTAAKVRLAKEGGARDMSDVIEELLSKWAVSSK